MAARDRFEPGNGCRDRAHNQAALNLRPEARRRRVSHCDRGLPCRDAGVAPTVSLHDIGERAADQRSGVDRGDAGPDDGQEILSKIRV
jgi:hypothetical protein